MAPHVAAEDFYIGEKVDMMKTLKHDLKVTEPNYMNFSATEYCPDTSCEVIKFPKTIPPSRKALFSFLYFNFGSTNKHLENFRKERQAITKRALKENQDISCMKDKEPGVCLMRLIAQTTQVRIFKVTYPEGQKCETELTYVSDITKTPPPTNLSPVCHDEN